MELRDPKLERFAQAHRGLVGARVMAGRLRGIGDTKNLRTRSSPACFDPSSVACRNYNRLLKRPEVAARVAELKKEGYDRMCAARLPAAAVLDVFKGCGIERVADFFEPDGEVALRGRDLGAVPVEAAIAFLRFLHESLHIEPALLDRGVRAD